MNEFCVGAFTGLLLGDSIGSYLEFTNEEINDNSVNKALDMNGGGHWNLGSGQKLMMEN